MQPITTWSRIPADAVARSAADLVACASIELSAHRPGDARELAALLPVGTRVYVNHLPRHTLAMSLAAIEAARAAGLEPVPHLSARRITSRREVKDFLERVVGGVDVRKVLLIGGDETKPLGPYADSVALLADGVLAECGVREVGISGYPEGHPSVPRAALEEAMARKLALAREQGLGVHVVTQFSFAPARIIEYCFELTRLAPGVPVYVGMAGPTSPANLLRYAQRCGVSASLRALGAEGMRIARLVTHTDPGEQLTALARYCALREADCNVVGIHLYSFGGAAKTAQWMSRRLAESLTT
jgi:methylenetetrahydrofolate reductase (NADPH)